MSRERGMGWVVLALFVVCWVLVAIGFAAGLAVG